MSADSSPSLWPSCSVWFWLGRGFGFLGVGGPWLALGLQVVESVLTPASGSLAPRLLSVGLPARPGRKQASKLGL